MDDDGGTPPRPAPLETHSQPLPRFLTGASPPGEGVALTLTLAYKTFNGVDLGARGGEPGRHLCQTKFQPIKLIIYVEEDNEDHAEAIRQALDDAEIAYE
jgi:hypothetical protein